MKQLSLEEMHQLLLRMLDCIHAYCMENNIRYSLGGGTLLGAIRHKGFIPWDDDADIMMPRPDYERFVKGFPGKYEHCMLEHWSTDPNFKWLLARVCDDRTVIDNKPFGYGLFVDVFPIDGLPPVNKHKKYRRGYVIRKYLLDVCGKPYQIGCRSRKIFKMLTYPICSLVPTSKYREVCMKYLMRYDFETSECTGCAVGRYGMREYMGRDTFRKYIDVEFEGHIFRAIADYDEYLTLHYGNYMLLPPIEKRKPQHQIPCCWKDK